MASPASTRTLFTSPDRITHGRLEGGACRVDSGKVVCHARQTRRVEQFPPCLRLRTPSPCPHPLTFMSISAKASLLNLSLNMSVKAVSLLPMSWHVLPWHSTFPNHPSHPRLAKLETAHNQHRTGTPLPSSTSGHRSVSRVPHDTLPLPGAHTGRNPQSGTGWDSRCASLPLFAIHLPSFPSLTVTVLGVKSYPRGVTTNSEGGIESYEA